MSWKDRGLASRRKSKGALDRIGLGRPVAATNSSLRLETECASSKTESTKLRAVSGPGPKMWTLGMIKKLPSKA